MKKGYFVKYKIQTGLSKKKKQKYFKTLKQRNDHIKAIYAAGCEVKSFGRVGV